LRCRFQDTYLQFGAVYAYIAQGVTGTHGLALLSVSNLTLCSKETLMTDLHKRSLIKVAAPTAIASAALVGCGKKEEAAAPAAAPLPPLQPLLRNL
jgi:hypothetical protein